LYKSTVFGKILRHPCLFRSVRLFLHGPAYRQRTSCKLPFRVKGKETVHSHHKISESEQNQTERLELCATERYQMRLFELCTEQNRNGKFVVTQFTCASGKISDKKVK
jgi:hypothetical protein